MPIYFDDLSLLFVYFYRHSKIYTHRDIIRFLLAYSFIYQELFIVKELKLFHITEGVVMSKKKLLIAVLAIAGMFSMGNAKTYTSYQIYTKACSACHGDQAQGNAEKKAPALNTMSREDLVVKLSALNGQDFETYSKHMVSNKRIIESKGMRFNVMKMANYIYYGFNIEHNE